MAFVFVTKKKTARCWNVFLWITLIAGWGLIVIFYTVEYYSRVNCPQTRVNRSIGTPNIAELIRFALF